jgi:putative tricarboxylic transport membrane protein
MGPGMLPLLIGGLLALVGIALAVQSFVLGGEGDETVSLPGLETCRAAFFVLLALLAFGLLIRPLGLFLATVVLVLVASRAEPRYPLLHAALLSLALGAMIVAIFVYGLGLPFRVWP